MPTDKDRSMSASRTARLIIRARVTNPLIPAVVPMMRYAAVASIVRAFARHARTAVMKIGAPATPPLTGN
jgi:hypothetical protein